MFLLLMLGWLFVYDTYVRVYTPSHIMLEGGGSIITLNFGRSC